jgi:hypothetical protein
LRIYRSNPDDNFTIIPNAALRDSRLSGLARSVLAELLTHSDGWDTNADALWQAAQRSRGDKAEGRRAFRSAFAELEEHGYLVRRKVRGGRGRFITVLELYDTPGHQESQDDYAHRRTGYATSVDDTSVNETSVSGTSTRSTNVRSTKEEETTKEDSATLVDTRVAAAAASARERDEGEQLHKLYAAVDQLEEVDLRNRLLAFERKRPRIYRECRQSAIEQIEKGDPQFTKTSEAGLQIDRLSFKYALQHYAPDWPGWLLRSPTRSAQRA